MAKGSKGPHLGGTAPGTKFHKHGVLQKQQGGSSLMNYANGNPNQGTPLKGK